MKTPLIAISNYVFNGLREDAIMINNGAVSEGFVKVSTDRESCSFFVLICREKDKVDPEIISRMSIEWSYKPIESIRDHYREDYLYPIIDK